ncbi:hypothetical protein MMC10_003493 [Thelotrema lepadinum]|nr:hypothetical protein [Thelotrema lepadinum]
MQVVIAITSGVELATGMISMVLGCEAMTVVGALLGPTMMNDPVLVARWIVTVVVVVVKTLVMLSLAAAELAPERVAVTVASSVVDKTLVIVVVALETTLDAPAAIEDEGDETGVLDAPAAIEDEGVETGTGTMVSVTGATDELETTAAAELEEDGLTEAAAAELDDEVTMAAAEVELVLPGQFVTSGAQEMTVISSVEVTVEVTSAKALEEAVVVVFQPEV